MPRSLWSGAINFGLVNIPVKLYNAVRKKDIRFHQLNAKDGARIQYKKVSSVNGKEVLAENIVKGYEISPDRYIVIKAEELEALSAKSNKSIDIEDFVHLKDIDPLYYAHSYYLVPDKGAAKAYALLLSAMKQAGKIAIAKVVLRDKQYLAALRSADNVITLSTMYFSDEVVPASDISELVNIAETHPTDRELKIALQLIESLATEFDPTKYKDEYRERVFELIESKSEGEDIVVQPIGVSNNKVVDLMSALEASITAIKKNQTPKTRRKKALAK